MDKRPDAYRTISEVADELGLPQHVLRFWETRFPQIKPLKRAGGRRYYKPDDIDLVRGIQTLLYSEGYTIKGVQRILKEDGVKPVQMVGRGNAFSGERPQADEPEDDVFTEDESVDHEPEADTLRATRDDMAHGSPAPAPVPVPPARHDPVFSSQPDTVDNFEIAPARGHGSRQPKFGAVPAQHASRRNDLQIALSELEECARLIEIARENR